MSLRMGCFTLENKITGIKFTTNDYGVICNEIDKARMYATQKGKAINVFTKSEILDSEGYIDDGYGYYVVEYK